MSVARITEIKASSTKSFDDAMNEGIKRAAKTLEGITGAWVASQEVVLNGKGKIRVPCSLEGHIRSKRLKLKKPPLLLNARVNNSRECAVVHGHLGHRLSIARSPNFQPIDSAWTAPQSWLSPVSDPGSSYLTL